MPAADRCPSLDEPRTIHIVGIGGPGMSPIAFVLLGMGHEVSGSDQRDAEVLERLRAAGATVRVGHDPRNLPESLDAVVISTAVPDDNVEVRAARDRAIPVVRRTELLPALADGRRTVSVAGTHGKTTTSSMLASILRAADTDPSFLIGGEVTEFGTSAHHGAGELFVLEADESDGSGFAVAHAAAIVTNVEPDHLEFHGSTEALHSAFADFLAASDGPSVVCADDRVACELGARVGATTYGVAPDADIRMVGLTHDRSSSRFTVVARGIELGEVVVAMPGTHNATNACGAIAMALELEVPFSACVEALARFGGVGRRFEPRGASAGVVFVDDYAHLPTEVAAAIAAGRDGGWERVVAVFQPHRFSRTEALGAEFAQSFDGADLLVLTDIYAAGERPRPGVSGRTIVDAVVAARPGLDLVYLADREGLAEGVAELLQPGDLCLTLGAGDITALPDEIRRILDRRSELDAPSESAP